jgi:hypothetical protein
MNFLFIHLGPFFPEYLLRNVMRLCRIFPDSHVFLLTDNEKLLNTPSNGNFCVVRYEAKREHREILTQLTTSKDFRQGFWRYSLERLFALCAFQRSRGLTNLLHIESDVLLMPNFPISKFKEISTLSWCRYNDQLDVAAILFSPNSDSATFLDNQLILTLKSRSDHTDMTALREIRVANPSSVMVLPSLSIENHGMLNKVSSISQSDVVDISKNSSIFEGIFDPAAIGVWLLGQNPENTYGFERLHTRSIIDSADSFIDPSTISYNFSTGHDLKISAAGKPTALFNLHVHSKNSQILSESWESTLEYFVTKSSDKSEMNRFRIKEFKSLLLLNLKRRSFLNFVLGIPPLYRLRMKFRKHFSGG